MRALSLAHPSAASDHPLRLVEMPEPEPAPGELILRVGACAVCRTDLQLAEGAIPAHGSPVVLGHQAVGRVVAIGPAMDGSDAGGGSSTAGSSTAGPSTAGPSTASWSIGDRAAVTWLAGFCGHCRQCLAGRENLCQSATFTGWDRDGGFAESMAVRADVAVPVPAGFDDVAAAPLLCGGVIGYRSLRVAGVQPGSRLGLFGFGASARLAIQVARHWGCEVYVWSRSERDRERADELGAAWSAPHGVPSPVPLDAAVTFAPTGDVVLEALRAVDRGGTVAINAIHLDRIPEFPYDDLWWERSLQSVANVTRRDAREFMALAGEIPIVTEAQPMPLAEGNRALELIASGGLAGAAVLVPG